MNVLLATDGSAQAAVAINTAVQLIRKKNVQYDLLCVTPEFIRPAASQKKIAETPVPMIEAYSGKIREEALARMESLKLAMLAQGMTAQPRVEIGSPARVISQLARDYILTVVGAHDRYTRSKEGLGPVATRVVATVARAILVGRELTNEKNWRILISVDGSLAAEYALRFLATYFQTQSAEITLMHVIETPWVHLGLEREWFDYPKEMVDLSGRQSSVRFENELKYEAESVVEASRRVLESYGLSANTVVAEGDPALEIISEAERGDYDLIVLGATGVSDLKHEMLGSVSTRVAQDALSSVLIVRFNK